MIIDRFLSEPKDFKDVKDEAGSRARKSKFAFPSTGVFWGRNSQFWRSCFSSVLLSVITRFEF